jgi:poly-gamma-glutamate capsule biosynthesis protein CapA/YwtB (metallophosphatase superfamily)
MLVTVATALLRVVLPDPCAAPSSSAAQVCLLAAGDVLFGRYIPRDDAPPHYLRVTKSAEPFAGVTPLVGAADLAFVNLETPVLPEPGDPFSILRTLTFRAEPDDLRHVAAAGFDVVSLANNHMGNFGTGGAATTRRLVDDAGMFGIGAGADAEHAFAPVLLEAAGMRVGFVALTAWDNFDVMLGRDGAVAHVPATEVGTRGAELVRAAKAAGAELVVVSIHWGLEHEPEPTVLQRRQARQLVKAGASLVLGHHPHIVQPIERIGESLVAYSLGNFMFDQPRPSARASLMLGVVVERRANGPHIAAVNPIPVIIDYRTRHPVVAVAPQHCWVWEQLESVHVPVKVPEVCRRRARLARR